MMRGSGKGWIQTFTGKQFYVMDPHPDDVCIEDIAHALACCNRYAGHLPVPYSVAQHSVHVATMAMEYCRESWFPRNEHEAYKIGLCALMHDAAEAYLGDMVRPLKQHIEAYQTAEIRVGMAIQWHFNLPDVDESVIKHSDNVALATERRDLMRFVGDWGKMKQPHPARIIPVDWRTAEAAFLAMFRQLRGACA